ncbi:hypothetical protein SDC9_50087 [bioreactor metagenome]|uniref:Mobile element protein CD1107-like domain-containing protein n=1 Tax=bioreactor metagenome TaxID=1076179 RepID=A0A644WJ95_9ZZZZ
MKKIRMLAASLCAVLLLCGLTVTAYASSDEDYEETTGGYEESTVTETEEAETQESNSFTPDGTGTVTDTATDEDGKQFYTITTPAGNTFYLIIDLERDNDNVYFLDAVTEADLLALAELSGETVTSAADTEQETEADTDAETTAKPETEQQEDNSNTGMLLLVAAVVLIGGGAAWYFKIHRPKQQMAEPEDDYGGDSDPYAEAESYADGADDDGPPWDEDRDGE